MKWLALLASLGIWFFALQAAYDLGKQREYDNCTKTLSMAGAIPSQKTVNKAMARGCTYDVLPNGEWEEVCAKR